MSAMRKMWADPTIQSPADPWANTAPTATAAPKAPAGDPKIAALQRALQMLGYNPGEIDGKMGPGTQSAIKRLQQANNLPADGRLNAPTQAAMANEMKTKGAAALGALADGMVAVGGAVVAAGATTAKTVADAVPAHAPPKNAGPDNRPTAGELVEKDVMAALSKRAYDLGYNDLINQQFHLFEINSWDEVVANPSRLSALTDAYSKGEQAAGAKMAKDLAEAHNTGKIPPASEHFSAIEIKEGRKMTRAERMDAMLKAEGLNYPTLDMIGNMQVNDDYLTIQEFQDEVMARRHAEKEQCEDDHPYWKPNERACKVEVDDKYGGPKFEEHEQQRDRQINEYNQKAEHVESLGAGALVGKALGRTADAILGTDKFEKIGEFVGGVGDVALPVAAGSTEMNRTANYDGQPADPTNVGYPPPPPTPPDPVRDTAVNPATQVGNPPPPPVDPWADTQAVQDTVPNPNTQVRNPPPPPENPQQQDNRPMTPEEIAEYKTARRKERYDEAVDALKPLPPQPGDGEILKTFEDVLKQLQRDPNSVEVSGSHGFHIMIWQKYMGRTGDPPMTFKYSGLFRVDVDELTPQQRTDFVTLRNSLRPQENRSGEENRKGENEGNEKSPVVGGGNEGSGSGSKK